MMAKSQYLRFNDQSIRSNNKNNNILNLLCN